MIQRSRNIEMFPGKILCDLAAFKIAKIFFQQISGKHDVKKGISYLVWYLKKTRNFLSSNLRENA